VEAKYGTGADGKPLTAEEYRKLIQENAVMGIVPPPNPAALKALARKKGIQTMKEQAKRLREAKIDPKEEGAAMAEWLRRPMRDNIPK
jgi:hypothetical protein